MTHPVVKRDRFYLIAALCIIFYGGTQMNKEDEKMQQAEAQQYEESVCIWEQQVQQGIPKEQADGHPDYDNRGVECLKS